MVTNVYLDNTLGGLKNFLGTYAADEIDHSIFAGKVFPHHAIVNTKTSSDGEMGHWILISRYYEYDKIILEIYDSFGYPISALSKNIKMLITKLEYDFLVTNNIIVQHVLSQYCGFFCIARILSIMNGESLIKHLNIFSTNLIENNDTVCDYIKSINKR